MLLTGGVGTLNACQKAIPPTSNNGTQVEKAISCLFFILAGPDGFVLFLLSLVLFTTGLIGGDVVLGLGVGLETLTSFSDVLFFEFSKVRGQAVLGRQHLKPTPWLTERHGYDPT